MLSNQIYIKEETFYELFDKVNDYLADRGYEVSFKDAHFLENLIPIFNEALEKGDIKDLRSIEFQFLINLEKGNIKELNHNLFSDFSLVFYYDKDALKYRFVTPRFADIFNSRSIHKLNVFVTFTRRIRASFLERLLNEKSIRYSKPVNSRINVEIELKGIEVIKYLI
jgi:hypothetical protein